jgi:peptidoglycan/xylan/chitin deacetylase (PgdA/CDA1 family)
MNRKFPILLYHRVGPLDGSYMDAYTVSPEAFLAQMKQIERDGWHPVSISDALAGDRETLPRWPLAITFDDGFASNREYAWPILERFGFPSETFVVIERLAQSNLWDGPENATWPLLSPEEMAAADSGLMTFHSHTATHPELNAIVDDSKTIARELDRNAKSVPASLANWGDGFAYPFGQWNWRVLDAVRDAGYRWACTCLEGRNSPRANPYLLRRVVVEERDIGARLTLKLLTGRSLLKWPPDFPPEVRLAKAWLSKELAKHGIAIGRSRAPQGTADCHSRDLDSRPAG